MENNFNQNKPAWIISLTILVIFLLAGIIYYFYKNASQDNIQQQTNLKSNQQQSVQTSPAAESYPYTLVAYTGTVFGAKVPEGWDITDTESGIDIMDPADNNTGASGAIAVGWFGYETPDGFIDFMLNAVGATDVNYESSSAEETVTDPVSGLKWVMKTKIFTFSKNGTILKAKASAGVLNGYGQFMGMITAFQTIPDKWNKWAPTLERIASSITIVNTSKAGGIDKVKLPTAADLSNDSSPLMESWEYRNNVQDKTSHEFSDAIMGQESDLHSPSTGETFTLPLNSYDPTIGGYRNPNNYDETLIDPYE